MIIEAIVTTTNENGSPNISPMGPFVEKSFESFELRPFLGSQTLENLRRRGEGVVHLVDDALLFVNALTHQWPELPPLQLAMVVSAPMLKEYLRAFEFKTKFFDESSNRISITCETVEQHVGRPPRGLCRGLNAVVEACILISRVDFLPREEIDGQLPSLQKIVEKTGGPRDREAMTLLMRHYSSLLVTGSPNRV
jgi:uncharacterized protein